jgi:hypothetical protein
MTNPGSSALPEVANRGRNAWRLDCIINRKHRVVDDIALARARS